MFTVIPEGRHKMKLKSSIFIIIVFVIMFTVYRAANNNSPIKIGYIGSLSGKYSALGSSGRDGAQMAVEEINRNGGINGHPLALTIKDDTGVPQKSLKAAAALKEEGIDIIIGPFSTGCGTAVQPYINRSHILTIAPIAAGSNLENQDDFFIKLYPSTTKMGEKLGRITARQYKRKKAVITGDLQNKLYLSTISDSFSNAFTKNGGTVVNSHPYTSSKATSFSSLAEAILEDSPDIVLIIASSLDTALLCQHIRKRNSTVLLTSSSWGISPELISSGSSAVEGIIFYVPYEMDSTSEQYMPFYNSYQERFSSDPTFCSIFNYEAVKMLAYALKKTNTFTPQAVKTAILRIEEFSGVQSNFIIDTNGDVDRTYLLHTIKNGTFMRIQQ